MKQSTDFSDVTNASNISLTAIKQRVAGDMNEGLKHFSDDSLSEDSEKDALLKKHLHELQREYTTKSLSSMHPWADPDR